MNYQQIPLPRIISCRDCIASKNSTASAVGRYKNLGKGGPFILIEFYISGIQCKFAPEANSVVCGSAYVIPKSMAIRVVEFSNEGYKIRKIFA